MSGYGNIGRGGAPGEGLEEAPLGWWGKIRSILAHDAWINFFVVAAVVVGFLHGWIKLKFRHPATTFLFDALLSVSLVLCFLRIRKGQRFFPMCGVAKAAVVFYSVSFVYFLAPSDLPWLVKLASLRAWCFPSLLFVLGYHLTHRIDQVKGYLRVFALMGVVTAIYGMNQSPEEIHRKAMEDEYFAKRYSGVYYQTKEGKAGVRIFSTFVSAGAFGGVMAFVAGLVGASLVDRRIGMIEKAMLAMALVPLCQGLALSGARSSLVMLMISIGLVVRYSGRAWIPLAIGLGAAGTFFLASGGSGADAGRFATLLESGTIWNRFSLPFVAAWRSFVEAPLGTGLGSSTLGVPFFLVERLDMASLSFRPAEGDLQSVITDMGLPGLIAFFVLLVRSGQLTISTLTKLRETAAFPIALACATALVPTLVALPVGSPFLGIPSGPMVWFFLGTLQKLSENADWGGGEDSRGRAPAKSKKFFYYRPGTSGRA